MKSLNEFVNEIAAKPAIQNTEIPANETALEKTEEQLDEARTKKEEALDKSVEKKSAEAEKKEGKPADNNGTKGLWAIDEPQDDDAVEPLEKDKLNKNMKRLLLKFKSKEPFFIVGEAGWGKTTIIKNLAKRFKRSVITVYLDKAVATDLGGIPVPVKGKDGQAEQQMALPQWAAYMKNNPDKQFLLFFDEMNQAAPDVMNALMPIVLENEICGFKYDNFMVGAAGNFEHENGAVNELSGPLKSRFKPIIIWETGGDAEWKQAFDYMHKKWDEKLSKSLIDKFEESASLFENPREVEHKILKFIHELKQDGDYDMFDADDYLDRLEGLAKEELTRTQKGELEQLAEAIHEFLNAKEEEPSGRKKRGADIEMVDDTTKNQIRNAMKTGFIAQRENGKTVKYGISRENIGNIFCDEEYNENPINAEMLERIISKFETDGIKFKYEKDEDWKKAGLKDPSED